MTLEAILADVQQVIRRVLDDESIKIVPTTAAKDIPEWDSVSHMAVMVAIERHFKIRFRSSELLAFQNVGEICAAIERLQPSD